MISAAEALKRIAGAVSPAAVESAPLSKACGRVIAEDLAAEIDLPAFANSAMDGFAVRAADLAGAGPKRPIALGVRQVVAAGSAGRALKTGEAAKIMTGAPVPPGADAIVIKELSAHNGNGTVKLFEAPAAGQWIRRRGEDVRAGEVLLKAGTRLGPYEIAVLAAQGVRRVPAYRLPRVGVLSTGSELSTACGRLPLGKIADANRPALLGALKRWGLPGRDLGLVGDAPGRLRRRLSAALRSCDALLVSGGVSAGDYDYTKPLLEELGVKTVFWKVKIKPGKPLYFGMFGAKPVFGLPGNPMSVLVCLEDFVRPALERLQGRKKVDFSYHLSGAAANAYVLPRKRQQRLFCVASGRAGRFRLKIIKPQASHMMARCARANALAAPPLGLSRIKPGTALAFRWLGEPA